MTERDRKAIVIRSTLLIGILAVVSNMWRSPAGWQHWVEISALVVAATARERVSYYWRQTDRTLWGNVIVEAPSKEPTKE